jgi:uncharacterized protein
MPQFSYTAGMDKNFDLKRLNIKAFARDGTRIQGVKELPFFVRLAEISVRLDGPNEPQNAVSWEIEGEMRSLAGGETQIWLHLMAELSLPLQCQRCMGAVEVKVSSNQSFRFVADEASAEAEDDECEEDLLVLTPEVDVWELMEDELIMSVPLVPKHSICPILVPMSVADEAFEEALEARPNPFAALAQLKKKPT